MTPIALTGIFLALASPSWSSDAEMAGQTAPTSNYRSVFGAVDFAEDAGQKFKTGLEKANYEVVRLDTIRPPHGAGFAFEIEYRPKAGYENKPLLRYQSPSFPSKGEALKNAVNWWLEKSPAAFVPLLLLTATTEDLRGNSSCVCVVDYAPILLKK